MTNLRMSGISVLLFVLAYYLNPLNGIMQENLTGPVSFMVRVGPELVVVLGKFILLMLVVGLPCVVLGPVRRKGGFLAPGLLCATISAIVSVLKFMAFEKGELEASFWFVIAPSFAFVYFLLGFVSGGLWGYLGNRMIWKAVGEES